MTINLSALTNDELNDILDGFDAMRNAIELLVRAGAIAPGDEHAFTVEDIENDVIEAMTDRAMEDAEYHVNQMVARGELDRYMRPDGEIGYAPPGWYNEGDAR